MLLLFQARIKKFATDVGQADPAWGHGGHARPQQHVADAGAHDGRQHAAHGAPQGQVRVSRDGI
jgi:hypothetical protein